MFVGAALIALALLFVLIAGQIRCALGLGYAALFGVIAAPLLGGAWVVAERSNRGEPLPQDQTASQPMTAQTCFKCHEGHYASWRQTYHRTMTREATPEYVKGPFDGAAHEILGVTARMIRDKDRYFMECEFPDLATVKKAGLIPAAPKEGPQRMKMSVDRLIGSHWQQQLLTRDEQGRYMRLPMAYHIVEQRWLHVSDCFMVPDNEQFFNKGMFNSWNNNCIYCHNTRAVPNPRPIPGQPDGFRTTVGELGISCEACHGAGESHVRAHQNPARRLAQRYSDKADPTIVNPAKLAVERSVDVCAQCHGGRLPRHQEWNRKTEADPFLAGGDLKRFWRTPFSYDDYALLQKDSNTDSCCGLPRPQPPGKLDSRFWGDGTPLSTGVEYQGMVLSACYQNGQGKMTCLTCHAMHKSDPNQQLKEGMRTNAACYSCHEDYRAKLVEHTHHGENSAGSLCYNCHMPRQAFGLMAVHPTHRITVPRVRDSLGTGKPHACNLCHLDKSLGWTQEQLGQWYGTKPVPLSDDERKLASSLLHLVQSDARTRTVFAGAFSWAPAQEASGRDWPGQLLARVLEHERFPMVRHVAHQALGSLHGSAAAGYDHKASAAARAEQLRGMRLRLEMLPRPDRGRYPYLPLTEAGLLADDAVERLLKSRNDPNVHIME